MTILVKDLNPFILIVERDEVRTQTAQEDRDWRQVGRRLTCFLCPRFDQLVLISPVTRYSTSPSPAK